MRNPQKSSISVFKIGHPAIGGTHLLPEAPFGGPGVPFSAGLQAQAGAGNVRFKIERECQSTPLPFLVAIIIAMGGWIGRANVVWDKVAGRQTLNCFEARPPLAKEEMPARPSSALTPASPQRRLLESWSSAPPTRSTCVWIFTLEVLLDDNVTVR